MRVQAAKARKHLSGTFESQDRGCQKTLLFTQIGIQIGVAGRNLISHALENFNKKGRCENRKRTCNISRP